ncbi:18.1 kDa class I heat shock protein-like [Prosopis cineraria]|uniref:18.1 kDa class I heat shock protein-like n=1 Tax=Prosopis cineraria TaxID=364024 RepID=UPI00240F2C39|nr:18.1 kDa class I heat shock protein-like [Prosopis cineraria]
MSLFQTLLNRSELFGPFRFLINENSDTEMDWRETREAHIFEIDLPGLTREDVKLEVHENSVLCISAERKVKEEEDNDETKEEKKSLRWHCKERQTMGTISRKFRLPENAKVEEIKATMSDGVLKITVPKDETKKKHKQQKKEIDISGDDDGAARKGIGRFVCCKA